MATLIISIDIDENMAEDIHLWASNGRRPNDWFPVDNMISLDEAYLEHDPNDDSFYVFNYIGILK
jgi:hypothetical protein